MPDLKKFRKWVETINTYYAFALLLYAGGLFVASNYNVLFWVFVITTPLLTGWTGYLLYGFLRQRNERHGFKILSEVMSYEIGHDNTYSLHYLTRLRAAADHLITYPMGYQWTGSGPEEMPKLADKSQRLLGVIEDYNSKKGSASITPYKITVSTEGDWYYWLVAFSPPVHNDEIVEIDYSQVFYDKQEIAKPYLYYFVRVPMQRLELNVAFPAHAPPRVITCSYIKPSDPSRPYAATGVRYDKHKKWATWIIENPKRGYCYRIHWK